MPRPVPERPQLPLSPLPREVQGWAGLFVTALLGVFQEIGQRLNGSIHKDGGIPMDAPFGLKPYTTTTLPDPAEWEGHIIYVSDGAAGAKFRGSDGTAWVNMG